MPVLGKHDSSTGEHCFLFAFSMLKQKVGFGWVKKKKKRKKSKKSKKIKQQDFQLTIQLLTLCKSPEIRILAFQINSDKSLCSGSTNAPFSYKVLICAKSYNAFTHFPENDSLDNLKHNDYVTIQITVNGFSF